MAELLKGTTSATETGHNPEKLVADYRDVMARLESATDATAKDNFCHMAIWLREQWADWQGEDSLHEMAFGEPVE